MKAAFFDAYGTLFDVHSAVRAHAGAIGPEAERLSITWRNKQLEYSWVHALMGANRYIDFRELTVRALRFAFADTGTDPVHLETLMSAYEELDAYPEISDHLAGLKAAGCVTGILSNGSPAMLKSAVASAGIGEHLDHVISVDAIRTFKTNPAAYELVTEATGLSPGEITFHSSNRWDIAGAAAFGFRTVWVNRTGRPDEYPDQMPDVVVTDLVNRE